MNTMRWCFMFVLAACAASVLGGGGSWAQEQPAGGAATPAAAAESAAPKPAGDRPVAAETRPLREQSIYIPYARLRAVFEKEGRGVFLPYEKFQELWAQARGRHMADVRPRPPAGAVVTEMESEATVENDVVAVQARLHVDVLEKGWHELPLRLSDAAIRSARIGEQPARVVWDPQSGHRLLVQGLRDEAMHLELSLEYAKAFSKAPGQNSVSFQAPQAPVNRWRIRIPQPGVKVNIQPMIAATEVAGGAPPSGPPREGSAPAAGASGSSGETVILAFVGAAPEVRIEWTPKAEGASGLEALASVQAEQEVAVEEGIVRTRARLAFAISRSDLGRLAIEVPADQKVAGVFDANIRQWNVVPGPEKQTIEVQLFEPARGAQNVTVEMDRITDVVTLREVPIPVVRAVGVGRQQGVLVVRLSEELQGQPAQTPRGLLQLDAAELPPGLKGDQWPFAYRYAAPDFQLVLSVQKIQPQIRTDELVEAYLEPEQLTLDLLAVFDVQRAGVFQLDLQIPADCEVRQVSGQAAAGAEPAMVDTFHREGPGQTRLKVNLARKALGRVGLWVELQERLDALQLQVPSERPSLLPFPLPRVATRVEQTSGRLLVYAPESLRISPRQARGARDISFAEALEGMPSLRQKRFPGLREVLAMAYTQAPVDLTFEVERRRPYVAATQLLVARFEPGAVKCEATFVFNVQYSAVKSLRIDVPADLLPSIHNLTPEFREETLEPQPEDVAKDKNGKSYVARGFRRETEVLGSATVRLAWEHKTGEGELGKATDYELPALRPMLYHKSWGEIRSSGQVVIVQAENLDVQAKAGYSGLRPVDPLHDLRIGGPMPDAARAFEFQEGWSLTLTATRYRLADEVKRTGIERAAVRMVLTRSNRVAVQALYRMRSGLQRLKIQLPRGVAFDADPLRVDGLPVGLEAGEEPGSYYIPLLRGGNPPRKQEPKGGQGDGRERPFLLELRYTLEITAPPGRGEPPAAGRKPSRRASPAAEPARKGPRRPGIVSRLDLPVFPAQPPVQGEPAVQKVQLCAYLPREWALLGTGGPWTSEQPGWFDRHVLGGAPPRGLSDPVAWVTEGMQLANKLAEFDTDGVPYRFSTLQPSPPPEGSLTLIAVHQRSLDAVVFGLLALAGLLFVRAPAPVKLSVISLLVIALVLSGVFAPTFAARVLDARLLLAIGLLVLVWLVAGALPRRRATAPREQALAGSSPPRAEEAPGEPPAPAAQAGSEVASPPPEASPGREQSDAPREAGREPRGESERGGK